MTISFEERARLNGQQREASWMLMPRSESRSPSPGEEPDTRPPLERFKLVEDAPRIVMKHPLIENGGSVCWIFRSLMCPTRGLP